MSIIIYATPARVGVGPRLSFLELLREYLDLYGAKKVRNQCDCGARTVLVDGPRVLYYLMQVVQCEERAVTSTQYSRWGR